jgi:hypothetical protein
MGTNVTVEKNRKMTLRRFCAVALLLGSGLSAEAQSFPVLRWQKFYGSEVNDVPARILKVPDGNLYIGGSRGTAQGGNDIWVGKVDTNGLLLWDRTLGGNGSDELRDMVVTPDSGLIFVGTSNSFIEHPEKGQAEYQGDYIMGKISKAGGIEWVKSYGGPELDQAFCIAKSRAWPEYVVGGLSNSRALDVQTELPLANLWAVKIGDAGEKRTAWTFGGKGHDWAYGIAPCKDGDYVVAGFTGSEDIDGSESRQNGDGWVARIDRYGAVEWQRIYSGKLEDYFVKVLEDREGHIVVIGNFESDENGKQFWFLKLTPQGKKICERIFGDDADEYATSIIETADRSFLMTGYSKSIPLVNKHIKGGEDLWVFKLDAKGEVLWANTYGGRDNERGVDVLEYREGVYYVLGVKQNNFEKAGTVDRGNDFWLLRIDEQACDDIDIQVYLSAQDYTAYVKKGFKLKCLTDLGDRFLWEFGDGTTSTDKEPVKAYDTPGVYAIRVTVFIADNCYKTYMLPEYLTVR